MVEVVEIEDLQIHAVGAHLGVGGQLVDDLLRRAREPLLAQRRQRPPDGGRPALEVLLGLSPQHTTLAADSLREAGSRP